MRETHHVDSTFLPPNRAFHTLPDFFRSEQPYSGTCHLRKSASPNSSLQRLVMSWEKSLAGSQDTSRGQDIE